MWTNDLLYFQWTAGPFTLLKRCRFPTAGNSTGLLQYKGPCDWPGLSKPIDHVARFLLVDMLQCFHLPSAVLWQVGGHDWYAIAVTSTSSTRQRKRYLGWRTLTSFCNQFSPAISTTALVHGKSYRRHIFQVTGMLVGCIKVGGVTGPSRPRPLLILTR